MGIVLAWAAVIVAGAFLTFALVGFLHERSWNREVGLDEPEVQVAWVVLTVIVVGAAVYLGAR